MTDKYILVDKEVHQVYDLIRWGKWLQDFERRIALTEVGEQTVSTVFLALDHSWGRGPPILFETLVFPDTEICERYTTYRKAINGHKRIVKMLDGSNVVPIKASG